MLFTQNIDCLEREAGVPGELIVEAHGSFAEQRCIDCLVPFPNDIMKEHVFKGEVPRCLDSKCGGLVKPDIVFFGEMLPQAFHQNKHVASTGDLILVMGTSLTVQPFASLPDLAKEDTPRVLFNLEEVGSLGTRANDVLVLGDCDSGIRKLADELGWRDELEAEWRAVVGEKEAERQLRSSEQRAAELQGQIEDLTNRVEEDLKLDDGSDGHEEPDTEDENKVLEEVEGSQAVDTGSGSDDTPKQDGNASLATQEIKQNPLPEANSDPILPKDNEEITEKITEKAAAVDDEPSESAPKADLGSNKDTTEKQEKKENSKEQTDRSSPENTGKPAL